MTVTLNVTFHFHPLNLGSGVSVASLTCLAGCLPTMSNSFLTSPCFFFFFLNQKILPWTRPLCHKWKKLCWLLPSLSRLIVHFETTDCHARPTLQPQPYPASLHQAASIISHLDDCSSLLASLPRHAFQPLHLTQNSTAHLVISLSSFFCITPPPTLPPLADHGCTYQIQTPGAGIQGCKQIYTHTSPGCGLPLNISQWSRLFSVLDWLSLSIRTRKPLPVSYLKLKSQKPLHWRISLSAHSLTHSQSSYPVSLHNIWFSNDCPLFPGIFKCTDVLTLVHLVLFKVYSTFVFIAGGSKSENIFNS